MTHSNNNKLRQILPYYHPSHNNSNNNSAVAAAAPPLKIPRLSSASPAASLEGLMIWNMDPAAVMAHVSSTTTSDDHQNLPSVGLGLGLTTSGGGGEDDRISFHHQQQQEEEEEEEEAAGKSMMMHGFTVSQLQELQLQSVIYKYIEAGAGVPPSLLVPIWRSLAAAATAAVPLRHHHHHQYPTLHHLFPSLTQCNLRMMMGMEYSNGGTTADPEPGRCRRTDGKKWRCSKEALPDQKYCEKHMHRGRHHSRSTKQVVLQPPPPASVGVINKTANDGGGRGGGGSQSSGCSSTTAGSCNVGGTNKLNAR